MATVIMGTWAVFSKPEYTATATVIANTSPNPTGKTLSFQEVATSNRLALEVHNQLNLSEDAGDLVRRIKVTSDVSNLYRVAVTDPQPDRAIAIANAVSQDAASLYTELAAGTASPATRLLETERTRYSNEYLATVKARLRYEALHPDAAETSNVDLRADYLSLRLAEQAAADAYRNFEAETSKSDADALNNARNYGALVVDEASSAKPDTAGRLLNVLYAAALALIVGIGIAFGLESLGNTVRLPDEAEELVGAPVIGVIPRVNARTILSRGGKGSA